MELKKIVKKGMALYRYDTIEPPTDWSKAYKSPFFQYDIGYKNAIGAFFLYDDRRETIRIWEIKVKEQNIQNPQLWITGACLTQDSIMLDLTSIVDVVNLYTTLYEMGIDIFRDNFYQNNENKPNESMSKIRKDVEFICKHRDKACEFMEKLKICKGNIWNFAHGYDDAEKLRYALQQLTDFDNGFIFKKILISQGYDGYIFKETYTDTYCFFECTKLSMPEREKINID